MEFLVFTSNQYLKQQQLCNRFYIKNNKSSLKVPSSVREKYFIIISFNQTYYMNLRIQLIKKIVQYKMDKYIKQVANIEIQSNNETEKATQYHPNQQQIKIPFHYELNQKYKIEERDSKLKLPLINNKNKEDNTNKSKSEVKQGQIELPKLKQQKQQQKSVKKQQQQKSVKKQQQQKSVKKQQQMPIENKKEQNNKNKIIQNQNTLHQQKQKLSIKEQIKVQAVPKQQKKLSNELQQILCFDPLCKSPTILFQDTQNISAFQNSPYYQNCKLILTEPITSTQSICKFRIQNIKYCIGFGIALKQVIINHEYNYKSQGSNELSHGLYIITSQGYSWSHSQKQQDDILRQGFKQMYNGLIVQVKAIGESIQFKWKRGQFKLLLPSRIREKYTLCYCAYLHEKEDSISISK